MGKERVYELLCVRRGDYGIQGMVCTALCVNL